MLLSLIEILRKTEAFFAKAGLDNPRLEAEWLLAHVLKCRRLDLYLQFERPMEAPVLDGLRPLVARRARREPLQYVLGETPFGALRLRTDRRALIPRPETEQFVEDLIQEGRSAPPARILDLGTGSGAIALALANAFPRAAVVAVDRSEEALALAQENAELNGLDGRVRWMVSDWFSALGGEAVFDWIVSNPPYLTEEEWMEAAPEVRDHEPRNALVAAEEGTSDLDQILREGWAYLASPGLIACETGIAQHERLRRSAERLGYRAIESRSDAQGRPRFFRALK